MWASIGFRKSLKTIANFPAIILTPAFCYWVFAPIESFSCSTWCCRGNSKLGVSFLHTWFNIGITVLGQVVFAISSTDKFQGKGFVSNRLGKNHLPDFLGIPLSCHIFSISLLIILQCLEKCNCCKSSCCNSITKRTLLNVDNPLEKIEFHQRDNEEHEMQIQI